MSSSNYSVGDWVIYRKQKSSTSPGPRAKEVRASSGGETYQYMVDKFWIVQAIDDQGILLRTRRGKENRIDPSDPRLRMPTWWERLLYRNRFQEVEQEQPESA